MTYLIANGHRVRTRRPRRASTLYRWDTKIAVTGVTRNLIHHMYLVYIMYLMYLMYLEPVRQQGEVRTRPTEGVCRSFDHEAHHRVGAADIAWFERGDSSIRQVLTPRPVPA